MLGHLLLSLSLPLFIGLVFSLAFEALLSPRPAPLWQRPMAANVIHLGSWLLLLSLARSDWRMGCVTRYGHARDVCQCQKLQPEDEFGIADNSDVCRSSSSANNPESRYTDPPTPWSSAC